MIPKETIKEALEKYGIKGVPTIVFTDASGSEARDIRVVGYVGPKKLVSRIEAIKQRQSPRNSDTPE